jgi:hypothetical protein
MNTTCTAMFQEIKIFVVICVLLTFTRHFFSFYLDKKEQLVWPCHGVEFG